MQRRIDIIEEVPDVPDDDTANLILRDGTVHDEAEGHQHPGKVRGREDKQAEETQAGFGVAPTPDIDQAGREGGAKEGQREEWRKTEKRDHGVEEQPGEVGWRPAGGLLQQARVALEEEDVEEEVEIQRTEVEEGCEQAPVLFARGVLSVCCPIRFDPSTGMPRARISFQLGHSRSLTWDLT